jgi:tail tube protein
MSEGARSQLMYGFEQTSGAATPGQKAATMYGVRVTGFELLPIPVYDDRESMEPRAQQLRSDIVGYNLPFKFNAEMSVDDLMRWRFHHQGFAAITNLAAGVNSWAIRDLLSSDSLTVNPLSLSLEGDRDDSYALLGLNAAVEQMDVKVAARKIAAMTFSGMACQFTHMNDVATVVGPASFTGTVYVRGNRIDSDAEDLTNDLKFKVTTAGGSGVGKIKFTKGATAYGSVEYIVTYGTATAPVWMDVILADGTHASGDPLNPIQIMFVGSGNLTAGGTPDEWKIVAKRTKATATYPARNPLKAARAIITAGGTAYDVENFDLTFKRPRKYRTATSSKMPIAILPDGRRSFSIKLHRDYVDRALYLKVLSGTPLSFDITINGDLVATVASVSYYEKWQLTSTNAQIKNAGANATTEKQLPEDVEIRPFYDGTNVDMSEVIVGTLSSLS